MTLLTGLRADRLTLLRRATVTGQVVELSINPDIVPDGYIDVCLRLPRADVVQVSGPEEAGPEDDPVVEEMLRVALEDHFERGEVRP